MQIKFDYVYHHEKDGDFQHEQFTLLDIECGRSSEYTRAMQEDGYKLVSRRMYTGLMDKNGKEIYGGDIIQINNGRNALVVWVQLYLAYYIEWLPDRYGAALSLWQSNQLEVIGNRWDNPGLLEGTG